MKLYPINLNIGGKKCLVVGGGAVAERKTLLLTECGAEVTVLSPDITPKLKELLTNGAISHISKKYEARDCKDSCKDIFLVFASTDDPHTNSLIADDARRLGILVNVSTSHEESTFTVPSVVRRGSVMVTASTHGAAPALSKHLRLKLEGVLGREYGILADIISLLRTHIKDLPDVQKKGIYEKIDFDGLIELIKSGDYDSVGSELKKLSGLDLIGIGFDLSKRV